MFHKALQSLKIFSVKEHKSPSVMVLCSHFTEEGEGGLTLCV